MNFVLQSKTNKDKSTEIAHPFSSHHLTLALVHCAIPRTKKGQQKEQILRKTTGFVLIIMRILPRA